MLGFDKAQAEHNNQEQPYFAPTKEIDTCEICRAKCDYKMCDDCYKKAVEEKAISYIASDADLFNECLEFILEKFNYQTTEIAKKQTNRIIQEFINEDRTGFEDWAISQLKGE